MEISCVFFGILFTVVGFLFARGKIHVRIPAWKNMPKEEKEKVNIKALARNIGEIIMLCGIIFLFKGFVLEFKSKWFVISMVAWFIIAGFDVWHISKSSKYQK